MQAVAGAPTLVGGAIEIPAPADGLVELLRAGIDGRPTARPVDDVHGTIHRPYVPREAMVDGDDLRLRRPLVQLQLQAVIPRGPWQRREKTSAKVNVPSVRRTKQCSPGFRRSTARRWWSAVGGLELDHVLRPAHVAQSVVVGACGLQ